MAVRLKQMEQLFNEGHSFVDLLPYMEFKDGIHLQSDGSFGKIWQVGGWEVEGRNEEYLASLSAHVQNFLSRMPSHHIACQIILSSNQNVKDNLDRYRNLQEAHQGAQGFMEAKTEHIQSSQNGFFNHNSQRFVPKNIRIYITLRFFPQWVHPDFWDKAKMYFKRQSNVANDFQKKIDEQMQSFLKYVALLEGILQGAGVEFISLDCKGLAGFLYPLLNPKRSGQVPEPNLNFYEPLRDQILFNSPQIKGEGFIFEGIQMRIVTLKELPNETKPGMFTRELYEATRFCLLDAAPNLMIIANFSVPSKH